MDTANSDLASAGGSSGGKIPDAPRIVSPSHHSSMTGHDITLLGTARAGLSVEVHDWLRVVATVVADDGEQWTVTVPDVESGDHLFLAYAIGTDGTRSSGSNAVAVSVSSDDQRPRPGAPGGRRKPMSSAWPIGRTLRGLRRLERPEEWSEDDTTDEWDRVGRPPAVTTSRDVVPPTGAMPSVPMRIEAMSEQRVYNASACLAPDDDRGSALEAQRSQHTGRLALVETTEHRAARVSAEELRASSSPSEIIAPAMTRKSAPQKSVVRSISAPHARDAPVEIRINESVKIHAVPRVLPVTTPEPSPTQVVATLTPERYDVVRLRAYSVPASRPVLHVHAVPLLSADDRVPGWQRAFQFGFQALTRHKRDRASMDRVHRESSADEEAHRHGPGTRSDVRD